MKLNCPECKSNRTQGSRGCLTWVIVIGLFPVGLLALMCRKTWKCQDCDHTWTA